MAAAEPPDGATSHCRAVRFLVNLFLIEANLAKKETVQRLWIVRDQDNDYFVFTTEDELIEAITQDDPYINPGDKIMIVNFKPSLKVLDLEECSTLADYTDKL